MYLYRVRYDYSSSAGSSVSCCMSFLGIPSKVEIAHASVELAMNSMCASLESLYKRCMMWNNAVTNSRIVGLLIFAFLCFSNRLECSALTSPPRKRTRPQAVGVFGVGPYCNLCYGLQAASARRDDQPLAISADAAVYQNNNKNSSVSSIPNIEDASLLVPPSYATPDIRRAALVRKIPPLPSSQQKHLELMWCSAGVCNDDLRERTSGERIIMRGPATGQVAYHWSDDETENTSNTTQQQKYVLFLVKDGSDLDSLLTIAADAVKQLTATHGNIQILLDPGTAARLKHYHGVDNGIQLFEAVQCPGFGNNLVAEEVVGTEFGTMPVSPSGAGVASQKSPNLIVTLGGDGLLMHAGMLFQGPMPPVLCVSGGSLGFLTPFHPSEIVPTIEIALGLVSAPPVTVNNHDDDALQVFPPNMPGYPYSNNNDEPADVNSNNIKHKFAFGLGDCICLSIRMRLDCRIITREGAMKARYNVLNEVVVDRGSSPYLAALECFCDDAHLTTVQADGVIFATPTGSTAYSLAAGSSVVHPAVPCILLTPICPHVLSFRSMVFPDHVILRCYVPDDARSTASVAFDGKHRQVLNRGDSVQIQMSAYPVPTINRKDHSADWLGSLKRSFNFNSRPRQRPL